MIGQQSILDTIYRLNTPEVAALFIGIVIALFLTLDIITERHLTRDIHRLVGLAISILLALIILSMSIGMGRL